MLAVKDTGKPQSWKEAPRGAVLEYKDGTQGTRECL